MKGTPPRAEQSIREALPWRVLSQHVTCVWVQRVEPGVVTYPHLRRPTGSAELVFRPGSALRVVGPHLGPRMEPLPPGTVRVGVRLRPAAAFAALGVSPDELFDADVAATDVWGSSAEALNDRLQAASSPGQMIRLLQQQVVARLPEAPVVDAVTAEAMRRLSAGFGRIDGLAPVLQISERQLRRRIKQASGLTPKALHRVLRFQRFLALCASAEHQSFQLGQLATAAGFADQAHLTREAVHLEGQTPRQLLIQARHDCFGKHDHAASYAANLRTR